MLRRWRSLKLGAAVSINGSVVEHDSTCNFLGRVAKLALYVEYSPAVTLLNDKEDVVYYLVDLNYRLDVVPSNLASFCNKRNLAKSVLYGCFKNPLWHSIYVVVHLVAMKVGIIV